MSDVGRLEGKVSLITGGARGQGAAEARLFAEQGAFVYVTDVAQDDGELLVKEIGDRAAFLALDVSDHAAWEEAARTVNDRHGRLDVLVNNAGIAPTQHRVDETPLDLHHRLMDVHLHGTFYGIQTMTPLLTHSGSASIINVSSIDGVAGVAGMASYSASKFAVTGLTRSAAIDLGPLGIRVNSIHPGIIASPMVEDLPENRRARLASILDRQPISRIGTPGDIANLALFLASDESAYCSGAQFVADGGHLAGPHRPPIITS